MKISEYLTKNSIIPELKSSDKYDVIDELLNLFSNDPRVEDLEDVRKNVFEREKIMSTGVGKGFAVPHGKSNFVKDIIVAFGRSKNGIDFEALDNQPVYLVFLLVGRNDLVSLHIKLLSRISKMMDREDFRQKLLSAADEEEIIKIFTEEEKSVFES
ncbi:MAG: PTS sugar transporter subunit IIA [Ignavibacterium sp.]|nr:PTS sugar transporter subunit IIA [Ignavibacterium sp.]MCX7612174.1 PTS sugar transporter subunit IIA [Ignavibacterium sp.]MDW8376241.1 PTS sugar transporter subunit IIA [Ignavibacteriales bacterium]